MNTATKYNASSDPENSTTRMEEKRCSNDDDDSSSDEESYSDSSSSTTTTTSSDSDKKSSHQQRHVVASQCQNDQDPYATEVRLWTERVPIGLGLCPWARKSQKQKVLRYITCQGNTPSDVTSLIWKEARVLCDNHANDDSVPPWSTTLIVCPHVTVWNQDFVVFDDFVKKFGVGGHDDEPFRTVPDDIHDFLEQITLVSFHPSFLRWRGLPKGIGTGSLVQCHKGMVGFRKSQHTVPATVLETAGNKVFGQRRVKVRFHDDDDDYHNNHQEQYIPTDWVVVPKDNINGGGDSEHFTPGDTTCTELLLGPPLPDNAMHRSPYPTVHLIRNKDLGTLCVRDISRVKRTNAKRMMKIGWEGVLTKRANQPPNELGT